MKVSARVTGIGTSRADALANALRQRALAKLQQRRVARKPPPVPRQRGER